MWNIFKRSAAPEEQEEKMEAKQEAPPEKDYNIYTSEHAVVVGIKSYNREHLQITGPDGQLQNVTTSGPAFNTTSFASYISELERMGHDMSHEKDILEELKEATEAAGKTEVMAQHRITGSVIGDPASNESYVVLRSAIPVAENMKLTI